ncbi:C-methytransferase [Schizosaccharomyces cryophilus OY26]|uniref:2-methoxy-6-polyprenyl-1,4-benzoquinol methylase, mitochondrial n=1 Tax=Schizosaccharomyces cryophilus (strain OY26 / ATCC MYA-4695 / CBS 11777 / NBRC 106824 / NRRL Y48691) TaxID=653667 RepID=S9VUV3_SCHCR|nr:C-methytransferase [Schizosaccharomyces cryophilus OY26]EPY49959.1 C-methytransferase [Schizosaccharomyces cryophilus OY26]
MSVRRSFNCGRLARQLGLLRPGFCGNTVSLARYNSSDSKKADESYTHFGFKHVPEDEKEYMVKNVFSSVAKKYDQMNDAMSLGIHRLWKNQFVSALNPGNSTTPMKILDVAGGTGDIAFRLLDHATQRNGDYSSKVIVADINPDMLAVGKRRAKKTPYLESGRVDFIEQNAEVLDKIPDHSIDIFTIAFGIRNCTHIDKVLEQAYRVLKPGGVFSCLEFSKVYPPLLAEVYRQYSFKFLPLLGTVIAGDSESYQYLVESIERFPDADTFASMIERAGFTLAGDRGYECLTFGVAAIHTGVKL